MKKNLGKILFMLFALGNLQASVFKSDIAVTNHNPFLKEAVDITVTLMQTDRSDIMYFTLQPKKNKDFLLILDSEDEQSHDIHQKKMRYHYTFYPLKEGNISLTFDVKAAMVNENNLAKYNTGSADELTALESKSYHDTLKPIIFHVKPIKNNITLVGDFSLSSKLDKTHITSNDQLNLTYTLKGEGYNPHIKTLLPPIDNVETFLEITQDDTSTQSFHYALIAQNDFMLPSVGINCFSPKKQKYYKLKTAAQKIHVTPVNIQTLVDKKSSLPQKAWDIQAWLPYLNGFLLFLAGFLSAKLNVTHYFRKKVIPSSPLQTKIKLAKDPKELLQLLLGSDDRRFKPFIIELEAAVYEKKKVNLKAIKDALSKL